MSPEVVIYGFETSNNIKVRVALGFKGIPYEFRSIDPGERDEILRISGQSLTPVMVHGDRVLFDSAAIMRYLDANFPETPKLFWGNRSEEWEIEDWEFFARFELAGPMMEVLHRRATGGTVNAVMLERCTETFGQATTVLAHRLEGRQWLVGDRMSAADVTAAAVLRRVQNVNMFVFPPAADSLSMWMENVLSFDGKCRVE